MKLKLILQLIILVFLKTETNVFIYLVEILKVLITILFVNQNSQTDICKQSFNQSHQEQKRS